MRALLVAGLGPTHKNAAYVAKTLFDRNNADEVSATYFAARGCFSLAELSFEHRGRRYPVMRPRRGAVPHLTTLTVESILQAADVDYEILDTADLWQQRPQPPPGDFDVVLLSTSFIWDRMTLARAIDWVDQHLPACPLVLGGQYSNLKWAQIMRAHPSVSMVVRGDGEVALPTLLRALGDGRDPAAVPNLVYRDRADPGRLHQSPHASIDLDAHPSPTFAGHFPSVPYESMRGCPFSCKFCSFPHASPEWRHKSARKIRDDWVGYAEHNGASFIKAMDSTFTVPRTRLRELFELLPGAGVAWEAYSRANAITDEHVVERLAAAHCRTLSIGFESMSDKSLESMRKLVTVRDNRRALELLRDSPVGYRCSFMVGYPGETPEDYRATHDFLVEEFAGHFGLSVFDISDETMPLWEDRQRLGIEVDDPDDPGSSWRHVGMTVDEAVALNHATLDEVRARNDDAVLIIWQGDYQRWLMPQLSRAENLRLEKAIERIAMLPRDRPDADDGCRELDRLLAGLERWGVTRTDPSTHTSEPLVSD